MKIGASKTVRLSHGNQGVWFSVQVTLIPIEGFDCEARTSVVPVVLFWESAIITVSPIFVPTVSPVGRLMTVNSYEALLKVTLPS